MNTETFDKIPEEKRQTVLNAAFSCFGNNGYKKTSISEIALAAGVSKASIFQYFGTKKNLYKFLYHFACNEIINHLTQGSKDLFECIKISTVIKLRVMEKHPGMYDFLLSLVKETDGELIEELKKDFNEEVERGMKLMFKNVEWERFKPEYDSQTAINLLSWVSEGCIKQNASILSRQQLLEQLDHYMAIMKKTLYKEEYL